MTWIRADCFTPTSSSLRRAETEEDSSCTVLMIVDFDNQEPRQVHQRCSLHKHIRNKAWSAVAAHIRDHPCDISKHNRVGWSSLVLALYHNAPVEVIADMLSLVQPDERHRLLSTPVPTGGRLSLHFAARFAQDLEVFKILVEPYPLALAVPSTDGNRPLDRAIYYRQDAQILQYLQDQTKKQLRLINNDKLRQVVLECCDTCWTRQQQVGFVARGKDEHFQFVLQFYGYTKEREMIGLFENVLSYVGIPPGRTMTYP
eukprot:scaffold25406_cov117-Cylindrotheca_fusiformis.AAC.4